MSMKEALRERLRRSPAWVSLRAAQREGLGEAFRRWRLWSSILGTRPVPTDELNEGAAVEVHLLCYRRDYLSAVWALKSFYHFARVRYPLVIHVQGEAPRRVFERLREHFPSARVVPQEEADAAVESWLKKRGLKRLAAARRASPFMLKLTDFPLLSGAVNLLTLDSDLVFFRRPTELLVADGEPLSSSLFQRDPVSAYNIDEARARKELGVHLSPRVNTGVALYARRSLDLARCEEYLAHPDVARVSGFIEQTLHALCASEQNRVAYLPDTYLVSLEKDVDLSRLVMRHYAGPSRPLLTEEGMKELVRAGFLEELGGGKKRFAERRPLIEDVKDGL